MARFLESIHSWFRRAPYHCIVTSVNFAHQFLQQSYWKGYHIYFAIYNFASWFMAVSFYRLTQHSMAIGMATIIGSATKLMPFNFVPIYFGLLGSVKILYYVTEILLFGFSLLSTPILAIAECNRYSRSVWRRCIVKGIFPEYTFRDQSYASMGYTVHPAFIYLFLPTSSWSVSHIKKSIEWTSDLLEIPWSLLCGCIEVVPNGWIVELFWFSLVVGSFIGPVLQGILKIHIRSLRRYFSRRGSNAVATQSPNPLKMVLVTLQSIFNSEKISQIKDFVSFDSDSMIMVVDNSANIHVCNDRKAFSTYTDFKNVNAPGVATIDASQSHPSGVGSVPTSWTDDEGKIYSIVLENVLHFPKSPVNILACTALATQLGDNDGTWIKTCRSHSTFVWNFGAHTKTIAHPLNSNIPEISVNEGYKSFASFQARMKSTILDSLSVNNVCITSKTSLPATDPLPRYNVGDKVVYIQDGASQKCTIRTVSYDSSNSLLKYHLKVVDDDTRGEIITTREFLRYADENDIGVVPRTMEQFQHNLVNLTPSEMKRLTEPTTLTPDEVEYLRWHQRLNHASPTDMLALVEGGHLPYRFRKIAKNPPLCIDCLFGKMQCRRWRTSKLEPSHIRKPGDSFPGAKVSIDQLISAQPGLIPRMSGGHTRARITAATIFKDHHTDLVYVHLMTSTSQEETLAAKHAFEKWANDLGIPKIQSYHADNGRFAEKGFKDDINFSRQTITFCAVGAHHQSGIVERCIGELTSDARTMLLYAQRYWPEMINTTLWPFALKAAEYKHNYLRLDSRGRSRMQRFIGTDFTIDIKHQHTFGCPVYVLDADLQSSVGGIPKWDPRSRVGIYLGHSPCHAGTVGLVLNPHTLYVSPQFHVVFDDDFTTVPYMRDATVPPNWEDLLKTSVEKATDEHYDLAKTWCMGLSTPSSEGDSSLPSEGGSSSPSEGDIHSNSPTSHGNEGDTSPHTDTAPNKDLSLTMPSMPTIDSLTLRRSNRKRKLMGKGAALQSSPQKRFHGLFSMISLSTVSISPPPVNSIFAKTLQKWKRLNNHFDGTINSLHPFSLSTSLDNETYNVKQMLAQDDVAEFITAMKKEVEDHERREHWEIVPRSTMPKEKKTIMMVWCFKRKRFPDGRINKHKARLCTHGGMQQWGVDYWETYAPVVNWLSIQLLLIISLIHNLDSRSIDFVLAFPQAKLTTDVYTELPWGFNASGNTGKGSNVLKLKKNLYGLSDAGFNWYKHLTGGLSNRGFVPSKIDPCVYYREDMILVIYVDDCVCLYKNKKVFDDLIISLREGPEKFDLTDDGNIKNYLGVDIEKLSPDDPTNTSKFDMFEMKQPYLSNRILKLLAVEHDNVKPTPATKPLLTKDTEGELQKYTWNYRQAICMLNYLAGSTRPDIAMAVHQCARFCNDPKLSHERAVQRIGRYLLGTREQGIRFIVKPEKGLECFVDADFAGGWDSNEPHNPQNVLSRTGFVIRYAGCPVYWCSKLQTEIALSTTEAEYIALSQAMRDVIPLMALLSEINVLIDLHIPKPEIHCKVFEDNRSCIAVATSPKFTPRTKHISLKFHHFTSFVKSNSIIINPIATSEQIADIFTKPLEGNAFVYLRKLLNGW